MGTQGSRERKINWILFNYNKIKFDEIEFDENLFLSHFALEMNSTIRTGKEILELLKKTERIK